MKINSAVTKESPEQEWRVLLALAQAFNPAYASEALNWRLELFSDDQARVAFESLRHSKRQVTLALPPAFDGLSPYSEAEMREARGRMASHALIETILPAYQANLGDALFKATQDDKKLAAELETIVRDMRKSLEAISCIASPTTAPQRVRATQGDLVRSYWHQVEELSHPVSSGIASLDRVMSGGLHAGRLMVVLGGPGAGKTSFANQIAEHVAWSGRPVVYVSTEEAIATLQAKTLARLGRINYSDVLRGWRESRAQINEALAKVAARESSERLLYLEESGADLEAIKETAMEHFGRYDEDNGGGPGLIVIDYLQKMARAISKVTNQELRIVVSTLCEDLRNMARMLNCTVIVLASLNRASGYDNSNVIGGGKESGDIEYSADVMIGLAREPEELELRAKKSSKPKRAAPLNCVAVEAYIAKNRIGVPDTVVPLNWRGQYQEFTGVSEYE